MTGSTRSCRTRSPSWASPICRPSRIEKARQLKAILNVEGNFLPNVDYAACVARGIRVLGCGPAFAVPVAEYALGLAIDLARGISREDRAFRAGRERYVDDGNADAVLLTGADIGLVGFGNLGRALARLLAPFRANVRAYDPWLPDAVLRSEGVQPASLDEVLRTSSFVFVLATITPDSVGLLDAHALDLLPGGARLVLASRAPIIDFDALLDRVAAGRLHAAIDVWPDEPVPARPPCSRAGRTGAVRAPGGRNSRRVRGDRLDGARRSAADRAGPATGAHAGGRARTRRPLPQPAGPMTEFSCRAVLFDCDGVLVDSNAAVEDAWLRWARDLGLEPDAVLARIHGQRSQDTVRELVAMERQAAELDRIDRYELESADAVREIPGAAALVASMPPGRWAVVTSGITTLATARLRSAGIAVPAVLVSADDVERGKPDPEGYRLAAQRLGVATADAIVLEDAPAGIAAARAAGVGAVVGVGDRARQEAVDGWAPDLRALRWTGAAVRVG